MATRDDDKTKTRAQREAEADRKEAQLNDPDDPYTGEHLDGRDPSERA